VRRCNERPYLDYAATSPLDKRVAAAMAPWWRAANAAASHPEGKSSRDAVARARKTIARAIAAKPHEMVFVSGATEADNLAIQGYADGAEDPHLITVETEHKAVLRSAEVIERRGADLDLLPVDREGLVDPDLIEHVARPGSLVSVMAVSNETGVRQPIRAISRICRKAGALFHVDAAQALGRIEIDVSGIDLLSLSGHKAYGPTGVGALFIREGVKIVPQIVGGRQENRMRAGTSNTPAIVGFAEAVRLAQKNLLAEERRLTVLRDRLISGLGVRIAGQNAPRVPGITCFRFPGLNSERLLTLVCERVCCSAGSACAADGPSHVMKAMGITDAILRLSLGRFTKRGDIEIAIAHISKVVARLEKSPLVPVRHALAQT
jgi:cysteine desulfurase